MRLWAWLLGKIVAESCSCDQTEKLCDCCCDVDCSEADLALLECPSSPTISDSVAVNNSLYLGTQYENRSLSDDDITALFDNFDAATTQPNCPGAYCSGDLIQYENAGNPENLEIMSYYYGECKSTPMRAFQYSKVKCPVSYLK